MRSNPNVCIEICEDYDLVASENACDFGMRYKSVIADGNVEFIDNISEKQKAVDIIVRQCSDKSYDIPESTLKNIAVYRLRIERISCKVSGYY